MLSCVTLFIFWIGIYPQTFLSRMEPTVKNYLAQVNAKHQAGLKLAAEEENVRLAQANRNPESREPESRITLFRDS